MRCEPHTQLRFAALLEKQGLYRPLDSERMEKPPTPRNKAPGEIMEDGLASKMDGLSLAEPEEEMDDNAADESVAQHSIKP
ncbi:MAG: hypothetical protein HY939_01080 [Gammaproteobacteria bacterium]|nr:hypothetical protein [Gammaproteobacteria bacterium]